jgi:hypothetical protein
METILRSYCVRYLSVWQPPAIRISGNIFFLNNWLEIYDEETRAFHAPST